MMMIICNWKIVIQNWIDDDDDDDDDDGDDDDDVDDDGDDDDDDDDDNDIVIYLGTNPSQLRCWAESLVSFGPLSKVD